MKILLYIITFSITFVFSAHAVEYSAEIKNKLKNMDVYFGNPSENIIIGQESMYLIIHNPTELAIDVMRQKAKDYCQQTLGNHFDAIFMRILGRYTAYFSCGIQNKIDQYNNLSNEEKECIDASIYENNKFILNFDLMSHCQKLNENNLNIINTIKLQELDEKKYITNDFVYLIKTKFYDQIEKHEQIADDNRINRRIQKNIKICKSLNFEETSKEFNQCMLHLMSLIEE